VEITGLLREWRSGDPGALATITAVIYEDLRRLAAHHLKDERPGHTLQATALVHEVFLRIHPMQDVDWQTRAHFLAVITNVMRNILVDHARRRIARKRSVPEEGRRNILRPEATDIDIVAIHLALDKMSAHFPRAARVVELRFFGGLDAAEAAEVLEVSLTSVERDWRFARAWLRDEIDGNK
jgi:RNA polymerase sigma factor (TIGR02999 family)